MVEEHSAEAGEREERVTKRHILVAWSGQRASGEYEDRRGVYVPYTSCHGSFGFLPVGIVPAVRPHGRSEITLCALEAKFVSGVEEELDRKPVEELRFRAGFYEPTLFQLVTLLTAEAANSAHFGLVYADHLAQAIATRLLLFGSKEGQKTRSKAQALPRHLFQRVLERMQTLDVNLDLKTLAAETGYSRLHFLRMFRASTGQTPHRYLLQLRLMRAKDLLQQRRRTSLIDIAATCGFSSQSHMSRVFRQLLGITPSEYRNNL
jgi:AraC family transcriptional regulator